ncbi:MAG: hypothetical protein GY725_01765 [bacterium]|nr:hypothetical protein [bacterium]
MARDENRLEACLGRPLRDLDILEIGPGQTLERSAYLGLKNRVTGIDLDVIPHGLDFAGYARVIRRNGLGRLLKTLGRRALGNLCTGRNRARSGSRRLSKKRDPIADP